MFIHARRGFHGFLWAILPAVVILGSACPSDDDGDNLAEGDCYIDQELLDISQEACLERGGEWLGAVSSGAVWPG